ncbi:Zn-ribbon domain-containing OB-fold protein [Pseudonocardia zijingensis]|uniref:OB-fold protein n=1 Tax=Pseudonocardia zijingensis TaxID=153376 RepID=A0ABP4AFQ2_9PSEU
MDLRDVPAPDLTDPLFEPYWSGAAAGKLVLPRCATCQRISWPPRAFCLRCRSASFGWEEHEARGHLFSWTVVGHPTAPGYRDTPYAVGIISLVDPPARVMGTIVDVEPSALEFDLPLVACFARAGSDPEFTLIQWKPAEAADRRE